MSKKIQVRKERKLTQWLAIPLLPLVIIGGYFEPYIGLTVLVLIAAFMLIAPIRGRLYCGWICPMGAFHERILALISFNKDIPSFMKQSWFRWIVFVGLMTFLVYRLSITGGSEIKIASVFRMMWIISTIAAILIGFVFRPRTWCRICPMGFIQGLIGKTRYVVHVGTECRQCGLCEKVCPIQTYPGSYKEKGTVDGTDCMRCFKCIDNCPRHALTIDAATESCPTCSESLS